MTENTTPAAEATDATVEEDSLEHTPERPHVEVFVALGTAVHAQVGETGIDWSEKVDPEDWKEHEERLRSVIDAEQEAELLGSDVLIG